MIAVNYCPKCGRETDNSPSAVEPFIDCDNCGRIFLEVWSYS